MWAVAIRFALAALLLAIWLRLRGVSLRLDVRHHPLVAVSGVLAYGVSYVLTYLAEESIPSGLVAICFTLMVFLTPLFARIALGRPTAKRTWIGGILGVAGVACCFLPSLAKTSLAGSLLPGVVMMLVAAAASSAAAVCSLALNARGIPVMTYTTWAMAYGAGTTMLWAVAQGHPLTLDARAAFWVALLYLSVLGSVVAFLCYLSLMRRHGPASAMYISVLSPLGAVVVSVLLEGLPPSLPLIAGSALALCGAWITLRTPSSG